MENHEVLSRDEIFALSSYTNEYRKQDTLMFVTLT